MNRTIRQTGAYALTCLFMIFMFSALMPILCLPLQAADSNDNKVLSFKVRCEDTGDTYDLLNGPVLDSKKVVDTLFLEVQFSGKEFSDYLDESLTPTVEFKNTFSYKDSSQPILDAKIGDVSTAAETYIITLTPEKGKQFLYQGTDSICNFDLTFKMDSKSETISFEAPIFQDSSTGDDRYSIQSTRFYNPSGKTVSKVTRGSYQKFEVTIYDFLYTPEKIEALNQQSKIKVSINSDFFSNNTLNSTIDDIRPIPKTSGVQYTITFQSPYYTGDTTRMLLDVKYLKSDGEGVEAIRTFDETIPGCELYNDSDDDDDNDNSSSSSRPDIAPPTPNIIISEFSYGGAPVTAASSFDLRLVFTNTSQKLPIDNIIMKVTVPEAFTLTSSSNTFYVESMAKTASVEKVIGLSVKPNAEPISHAVKLSFSFEAVIDRERKQFTSEEEISIPVSQLDRFSVNPVEVPPELAVGEDTNIEITFVNKGKTPVYNVTAEITGNISQAGQRQFIGNVESGHEDSADFLLAPLEEGPVSGEIIISYEDANMNITELRNPFSATAVNYNMPPPDMDMGVMNPEDMEPMDLPWYQELWQRFPPWVWGVGGLVVVILLGYIGKVIRVHRERKLLEDDDDEDL